MVPTCEDATQAAGGDLLLARLLIWSFGSQRERRCALFQDDKRCAESCGLNWASPAKSQVPLTTGEKAPFPTVSMLTTVAGEDSHSLLCRRLGF